MKNKSIRFVCLIFVFIMSVFADNANDIFQQITQGQQNINTFYAKMKTTTTINGQVITSYSKLYRKGNNKSRMEIGIPSGGQQVVIQNEGKYYFNSPMLEEPIIKNYGSVPSSNDNSQNVTNYLKNLVDNSLVIVSSSGSGQYILKGEYKSDGSKVKYAEFDVDTEKKCVEGLRMFNANDELISDYKITNKKVNGIWTTEKMEISTNAGQNKILKIIIEYTNIKINHTISESVFSING